MAKDAAQILENFKAPLTMVRGKKYTFNVNTIETNTDGTRHPFYFTTDNSGGAGFPGAITQNVENAFERHHTPDLSRAVLRVAGGGFMYSNQYD